MSTPPHFFWPPKEFLLLIQHFRFALLCTVLSKYFSEYYRLNRDVCASDIGKLMGYADYIGTYAAFSR